MAEVVVVGAGMCGLSTAMLLAKDGHDVTVLERDAAPPPEPRDAWDAWERRGVGQFRMLHYLQPRWRAIAEAELPELVAAFEAAGALRFNIVDLVPEDIIGPRQDDDGDLAVLTSRRPVAEAVTAAVATGTERVTIRRGVAIDGVVTGTPARDGVPHIIGVHTDTGETVMADLVVDTTGRRSALASWLVAAGARRPIEEEEDLGFVYYGRHFHSGDGPHPAIIGPLLTPYDSVSILSLPADNGAWGMGIITSGKDADLRALRDNDTWMRVARSYPLTAHWVDGEPLDDVAVMAKLPDRYRRFVVDDEPVATGLLAVGDSWACTNPSLGRGITLGLMHVLALRDLMRTGASDDPYALAVAWDEITESELTPWYEATRDWDRHRLDEIAAEMNGQTYEFDDPQWEITHALMHAAGSDGDVFRGFLRIGGLLATADEVLGQPGLLEKVIDLGKDWRDAPPMGPSRNELMKVVHA